MKIRILAIMAVLLAGAGFSRANIIGNTLADDGDGVLTCATYGFLTNSPGNYQLSIYGDQNIWGPGHIVGDILTDGNDPTLALYQSIENDTGTAWGDYHVQVTMNHSFTFSSIGVANSGWTFTSTVPTLIGSDWIGNIDYYAGTPVPADNVSTLDFNYSVTFTGSVSFTEQLTPSTVPEPGTFALMICGLAGLLVMRRRSA
jgi:hypothetical protein